MKLTPVNFDPFAESTETPAEDSAAPIGDVSGFTQPSASRAPESPSSLDSGITGKVDGFLKGVRDTGEQIRRPKTVEGFGKQPDTQSAGPKLKPVNYDPFAEDPGFGEVLVEGAKDTMQHLKGTAVLAGVGDKKDYLKSYLERENERLPTGKGQQKLVGMLADEWEDVGEEDTFWGKAYEVGDMIAKGSWGAITDPKATADIVVRNLPNMVPTMAGMGTGAVAGGAVGGPIGAVVGGLIGMTAGTTAIESGAKLFEKLQERSPNLDEKELREALNDEEFIAETQREGLTKGAIISGIDAVSMGVLGKMMTGPGRSLQKGVQDTLRKQGVNVADPAQVQRALANPEIAASLKPHVAQYKAATSLPRKAGRGAAAIGTETVGEGVGELLGERAASGEWQGDEAFIEAIAGFGTSLGQAGAVAGTVGRRKKTQADKQADAIDALPTEPTESITLDETNLPAEPPEEVETFTYDETTPQEGEIKQAPDEEVTIEGQAPQDETAPVPEYEGRALPADDQRPSPAQGATVTALSPDETITMEGGATPDLSDFLERGGIARNDGTPFPTKKAAQLKAKSRKLESYEPVKVGAGWGLRPPETAPAAQPTETPISPPQAPQEAGRAVQPESPQDLDQAAQQAATSPQNEIPEPSPSQIEAGNYRKGKVRLNGLDISVENPKGSTRSGTNRQGQEWSTTMKDHYGYIRGTKGKDKDHVDVFMTDQAHREDRPVFVVDQVDPETGSFDEHKVVMGARNEDQARKVYRRNYEQGWNGLGAITQLTQDQFKEWTKGDTTRPLALGGLTLEAPVERPAKKAEANPAQAKKPAPQSPATPQQSDLVGKYIRSGSTTGRVTEVSEDGKKATLDSGRSVPVARAPNWTVQDEPFPDAEPTAQTEPAESATETPTAPKKKAKKKAAKQPAESKREPAKKADTKADRGTAMFSEDTVSVKDAEQRIRSRHALDTFSLSERDGSIVLNNMVAMERGEGAGTAAMQDLVDYADQTGRRIILTPGQREDGTGTTSTARLKRFYKRFGFVENKGRHKDFSISEGMYREPQTPMFATAYHASPYTFDRFDISKIGTGEGNQAYGYGLYLAENPVVGGEYLSIFDAVAGYDYPSGVDRIDGGLATSVLRAADGDKDLAIQMVKDREFLPSSLSDRKDAVVDAIGKAERKSASLYKVDISDSAVAKMLDWDKSLSEQPQEVQDAVMETLREEYPAYHRMTEKVEGLEGKERRQAIKDAGFNVMEDPNVAGMMYESLSLALGSQERASKALQKRGIPGIKYLDQGSRAQGEGTRNFVIFDDSLITILERNGEPVTGAEREQALMSMQPGDVTQTEAFQRWFGDSKVVDENGEPLVVYHWTDYEFDAFDTTGNEGAHFGTAEAASDRARGTDQIDYDIEKDGPQEYWVFADHGPMDGEGQGPFTSRSEAQAFILQQPERIEPIAAYLSIRNPVRTPDLGMWSPWEIIKNLPEGTLTDAESDRIMGADNKYDALKDALVGKGIDGIVYENTEEDPGSTSYIAFRPEQIKSVDNRGTFDPADPNILRSESATPGGMSTEDAREAIGNAIGKKALNRLEKSGRFTFVPTPADMNVSESERRRIFGRGMPSGTPGGLFDPVTGKSWIFTDNVRPNTIVGKFYHEVGSHYGLPRMIGKGQYNLVKKQLQNLANKGDERVLRAIARVPKETAKQHQWDEVLAYLMENNHEYVDMLDTRRQPDGLTDPLVRMLRRVIARIKAFLNEIGVVGVDKLGVDDIVELVRGAAVHAAKTAPKRPIQTRPGVYDKVAKGLTPKGTAQSYARQVRQMVGDGQITQAQADRIIPWLNQHKRTPSPSERLDETVLDIPARRSKTIRRDDVLAFLSSQGLMSQESRRKQRLRDMGMDFENLPGDEEGNPTQPTEPVDEVPDEVDTGTARTNLQEQGFEAPEDEGFNGPDAPEGMFSIEREYTEEQKRAIEKGKFGERGAQPTARERIKAAKYLAGTKIRQGVVDQFASLKNILGDTRAWMMAQISQATTGALEATVDYGRPFLRDNAIGVDVNQNSLKDVLEPLGVELDDWLKWMAGNRAERLKAQDRERLFDEGDIRALKSLNQGRMADGRNRAEVYEQVRQEFETLSQAVNQIAVDTGLIGEQEAREWAEQGFYLPFYRMLEGESRGPRVFKNGLAKQTAYKKLKGADVALDDLLGNLLTNWNHLLSASMRNQAAVKSLHTAEQMGIAQRVSQAEASKDAIWVREDGQQVWYEFDDTPEAKLVMDSLLSLNYEGLRQFSMRVMRRFKRALTVGVTVNPEFRIANLIRDTLHSAAVVPVSTNIAKNVIQGVRMTKRGTQSQASMIAGGGAFGDSGYIHGTDPELIRRTIAKGVGRDTILDTRGRVRKMWDKYQDFGARMENVNRAAAFAQAVQNGQDLLEANFEARDLLDFQRTGGFTFVRALTQTVPFLNARLQGLDKMYRAVRTPGQRRQFATVSGVYALAAVGLYLMMKDDDDYNEAEEWEKDAYHLFKIPGSDVMYRIPKPFEVGVIGTMAERLTEQVVDDNVHGTLFAERMWHALQETLSFNPIPQAALPMIELVSNKSFFTGRNIENLSMSRLSPEERKRAWTSQTAIGASQAMSKILWDDVVLSPVQVEHLVNGYLGWMGGSILGATDMLVSRPLAQSPDQPERRVEDYPVVGRFIREADSRNSKFVTRFYENLNDVTYAWGDIRQARELGNREKASAKIEENRGVLKYREAYNRVQRTFGKINSRITQIHMDETLTPTQKRNKIDLLNKRKKQMARRIVEASSDAFH